MRTVIIESDNGSCNIVTERIIAYSKYVISKDKYELLIVTDTSDFCFEFSTKESFEQAVNNIDEALNNPEGAQIFGRTRNKK